MRTQLRTRLITGLVGGAIMSLLGPRPIFVRTAYAGPADATVQEIVMDDVALEAQDLVMVVAVVARD